MHSARRPQSGGASSGARQPPMAPRPPTATGANTGSRSAAAGRRQSHDPPTTAPTSEDPYFLKSIGDAITQKTFTPMLRKKDPSPSHNLTRLDLYTAKDGPIPVPSPRPGSARPGSALCRPPSSCGTPRSEGRGTPRPSSGLRREPSPSATPRKTADPTAVHIDQSSPYMFGTYTPQNTVFTKEEDAEVERAKPTRPPRPQSADPFREVIGDAFTSAQATSTAKVFCPQPPVAPDDTATISTLGTFDDVVSFFSRTRATKTPVKFIHMLQVPQVEGQPYEPFNLQVLDKPTKDQLAQDHLVVSSTSVVMRSGEGLSTEVTPLAVYAREASMFAALRKIHFFSNYLKYKAFASWLKGIRRRQFLAKRKALSEQLFLAKRNFAAPLRELRKHAFDLAANPLLKVPSSRDGILREEFAATVVKHKTNTADGFRSTVDGIDRLLTLLCQRIAALADVPDFASSDALNQYFELTEEEAAREEGVLVSKKAVSIVQSKKNTELRMQQLKSALSQYLSLPNFVRLVDSLCTEALYENCVLSIRGLRRELASTGDAKLVSFIIAVHINEEGLHFLPPRDDMMAMAAELVEEFITSVAFIPRLMNSQNYSDYYPPTAPGGRPRLAPLADALRRDHRIIGDTKKINSVFHRDFQQSEEATAHFRNNSRWIVFVNTEWTSIVGDWDGRVQLESTHKEIVPSLEGAVSASEVEDVLRQVDRGVSSVKELHTIRRGCLLVTPLAVMEFLLGKLREVQEGAQMRLTKIARGRLDRLSHSLTSRMKLLQERPTTLSRFTEFAQNLNNVLSFIRGLETVLTSVEEIFTLGERNGFTLEETSRRDAVLGEPTASGGIRTDSSRSAEGGGSSVYDRFIAAVESAKEFRSANLEDMLDRLHDELDEVEDSVQSLMELLAASQLDSYTTDYDENLEYLRKIEEEQQELESRVTTLSTWEVLLEGTPSEVTLMESARKALKERKELWTTIERWESLRQHTFATPLCNINIQDFSKEIDELFTKTYSKLHPKYMNNASETLLDQLRETKQIMPVLLHLGNKDLRSEHWSAILAPTGRPYDTSISLESAKQLRLFDVQYREVIAEQSEIASGEARLTATLESIEETWSETEFNVKALRHYADKFILDDVSDIVQLVEEHQLLIQGCLASRFVSGVRGEVEAWDRSLSILANTIDEWLNVQGSWMYLEYIFSFDDIKTQLPAATSAFQQVDKDFTGLISRTRETRLCMPTVLNAPVLQMLLDATAALDDVQRQLEEYLETKRAAFPRFYFLSNDELLSILSDVRNPKAVQPHLRKCFENIKSLIFASDDVVSGMVSAEGETVAFHTNVSARGNVEVWLRAVEMAMISSLKHHMKRAINLHKALNNRIGWILSVQNGPKDTSSNSLPAQCIQAVDMGVWTGETEAAIAGNNLPAYLASYLTGIDGCVKAVRGELSPLQRALFGTLLVLNVHNRDVLETLVEGAVTNVKDFKWTVQLRYYYDAAGGVSIEQVNAKCAYSYEYLGSVRRLVITPLTDRAFLTCTQAVHLHLGGAPQGPAGTGKTESVKDLGKALARQVVVFNCSDGINVAIMSRMFAGLAQAGAWACFDEFNRIELEVLSVIAQQMLEITSAVAKKKERMVFDGREIALHPNFGVFVTMNPGYAGRTELPDNLKALFRPVCMMVPDYRLIAEIMFFSEGFSQARSLSTKMVQLYKLSSEQLSKQDHYDFGMRAVKSVLVLAGALKREFQDEDENMLLIRAMRDTNIPKFLREDAALFRAIIQDLYPGMAITEHTNATLTNQLKASAESQGLQATELLMEKALQLYDTVKVRHGLMLVGATLSGKTETMNVLEEALTTLGRIKDKSKKTPVELTSPLYAHVSQHRLNPKAVTGDELYGVVNATTREWSDGVLSSIARNLVSRNASGKDITGRHWVVFDGPVDAVWIENMNTVLDDNKMLCLVNGERLKIPETVTFCFEVEDLKVASPATVSRCGMVYFEPIGDQIWLPLFTSLNASMGEAAPEGLWQPEVLQAAVEELIRPFEANTHIHMGEWIPTVMPQLVRSMMLLLQGLVLGMSTADDEPVEAELPHHQVDEEDPDEEVMEPVRIEVVTDVERDLPPTPANPNGLFRQLTAFAFIWAFGGNGDIKGRTRFDETLGAAVRQFCPSLPEGSLFANSVHRRSGCWVPWEYRVPAFIYNPYASLPDMIVPTPESTATRTVLLTLLRQHHHILLTGMSGTGKSVTLRSMMFDDLNTEDPSSPWDTFPVVFSARTTATHLMQSLNNKLRKHPSKTKNTLHIGPSADKRVVLVMDDINMPQPEQYGASPPLELLRQLITQGGMYDPKKCMFKHVSGVSVAATCAPPGGGRNETTRRLTSQFFSLCQPELGDASLRTIFSSLLQGFLHRFTENVQGLRGQLVSLVLQAYTAVKTTMRATPDKPHYVFGTRDVGKVVQGIMQMDPPNIITKKELADVAVHELSRVLHDRLTCQEDRNAWFKSLGEMVDNLFDLPADEEWPDMIFGDFGSTLQQGCYNRMEWTEELTEVLDEKMSSFGLHYSREMDLVMFKDAVLHVVRLARIIRQPRGHALLVGVSGSGRQSLANLASFIAGSARYLLQTTRNYDVPDFREDIKKALLDAGCENRSVTLIMGENQLVKEAFLEDVNYLLNTGELPIVWEQEEMDRMVMAVRPALVAARKPETINLIKAEFVTRCRNMMHIVLTVSPVGSKFRHRLRMFPALVSSMTIDWYGRWPRAALLTVSSKMIRGISGLGHKDTLVDRLGELSVGMHQVAEDAAAEFSNVYRRPVYLTPTNYLAQIELFVDLYEEEKERYEGKIARFRMGMSKLGDTKIEVDALKEELTRMQPLLVKQSGETEEFAKDVAREQDAATIVAEKVSAEEATCGNFMAECKGIKDECQSELDKAMPAYHSALDALNALNTKDINEARSYTSPPKKVALIMDAVLVVLDEGLGWDNARRVMGRPDFIQSLKGFNADNVPEKILKKLKKYTSMDEFSPGLVQNVSRACVSFCMWCIAIDNYCDILKVVKPKQAKLKSAEDRLSVASAELKTKQAELAKVEGKIADLKGQYTASQKKLTLLEQERNRTELHLVRAEKILTGLASEEIRWSQQVRELEERKEHLVGSVALAAAMITYGGPFNGEYRSRLSAQWIEQCLAAGFSLENTDEIGLRELVEPVVVRGWASHGLPKDVVTISNGIMATKAKKWCLCIDPQGQANRWIRSMYRDHGLMILKPTDPDLLRNLETAVRMGQPVLLEGVGETVDPSLDPILTHATFRQAGAVLMTIRDQAVEYHPDFFFIMTTRLPNPHYLPEVQVKVTLLNFSLTEAGLQEQLLGEVVRHEENALEERADSLVVEIAENEAALADVQDRILQLISAATGNLLENEVLINTLGQSKATSEVIQSSLASAGEASKEIKEVREQYRSVASHAALLYMVVSSLGELNHTYQTSLVSFVSQLYATMSGTVSPSGPARLSVTERCKTLVDALTYDTYCTVSRGMFEKDKRTFAFLIASRVAIVKGDISDSQWQYFLRGARGVVLPNATDSPAEWISDAVWEDIEFLGEVKGFPPVSSAIAANVDDWKELWDDPSMALPPVQYRLMSTFQKLMFLRTFKPEAAFKVATQFTDDQLGTRFVRSPEFNLGSCFERSSPTTPVVLILSEGTDPTSMFEEFATKSGHGNKRHMLSLGQGQGPKAEKLVTEAVRTGHWVYLQNCHVYSAWMPALEELVESLPEMRPHADFRLWLTTLPVTSFPIAVLQLSVKVTKEPPAGLKANFSDTVASLAHSALWTAVSPAKRDTWHRMLFSMSLFHASVLQRRRFGPLGWNTPYEWNSGDLNASVKALRGFVEDSPTGSELPWTSLHYLIGSINYGGRVTDQWDTRCLESRVQPFLSENALRPGHSFSVDGSYKVPTKPFPTPSDALRYIEDQVPAQDTPALFGLHDNAELAYQAQLSTFLLQSVVSVQPRASATAGGGHRNESLDAIADLLIRLPEPIDRIAAHPSTYEYGADGTMTPLSAVALQEVGRFNATLGIVKGTLEELQLCLTGVTAISDALETALDDITKGKVPEAWIRVSYASTRGLSAWFVDFGQRIEFFRDWNEGGAPPSFWLGGFVFPQGFLTAVLQTFSRQHRIALDGIGWKAVVSSDFDRFENALEWLPDGVYVYGLSVEGARWDIEGRCMAEQLPRQVSSKMPIIALIPVSSTKDTPTPTHTYECPTYKSSTRRGTLSTTGISTNFIVSLELDCGIGTPDLWIGRGAALIASPTD